MSAAELRVLGPVEVVGDDGPVALAGKQRRLLAALVVADGRACGVDALVDAVWGDRAPASAAKLVQVYVSQLRKALPAAARVVTRAGAYALELERDLLDAHRFERLVAEGKSLRAAGNPALAASLIDQALRLWRGRAYGDLAYEELARAEADRLEELRLVALEERTDAQLALGKHDETLGEILGLAADNPLRERLHAQAMLALYRCGRQADALAHYNAFRQTLRNELGLEPGPALRALQQQILRQDAGLDDADPFTPGHGALPAPISPLVGRDTELAELADLLARRDARLIVLTGAGGSGKTRLALEAARDAATSYANGVMLVELAPLRDPELVVPTIAHAVGIADVPQPLEALAEALRSQELLLLLDNAEHVQDATPALVGLLAQAPRLTILVTSRTVLHLSGEHVFPVPPLEIGAALALFEQRARALQPDFTVTEDDLETVRELCRRVDCLPLAVELAAARVRALRPQAVLDRLTERLSFLTGGPHDLPARQQTLYETLDWSYDLLPDEERGLLAGLSVFRGGATLSAVAEVCLAGDEGRALDRVERLADASLLLVRRPAGETRYDLLEVVRQYAADRLDELGADSTRSRHAAWCVALAERAEPELSGESQASWLSELETEHDNMRAALAYFAETGGYEQALRLTVLLSRFWYVRGHLVEARRRLEAVLPSAVGQDPNLLRRAQTAGASIALLQGDYVASTAFAESALDSARRTGEPKFVANALSNLGAIVLAGGDEERAAIVLDEALALAREVGDERITALVLNNLGDLALSTGDYRRARPFFEESHALLGARGDTANLARSQFNRGAVDLMLGDRHAARVRFREGLVLANETGDKEDVAWCLEGLASVAAQEGDGELAATLLGVSAALLRQMGAAFKPFERQLHEATHARAQTLCGIGECGEAMARGESLSLATTLELAIGSDDP
ncbi:MAG TPA: BTAD domain-containing putative transcriptional regulator [Gaiella sp.]|nr:BTAD domain-containing putative transcriptional regulator [Gaiella sp.]